MGNSLSDIIGIEAAGNSFADALKEAEANATMELHNVALTGINYIKSFTPIISLILVFLILLLLVGILSILSRMLDDLGVSKTVRRRILLVVSIVLYIWFVVIQITAAVKQKNTVTIAIAVLAILGLVVIVILSIWFSCRTPNRGLSNSPPAIEIRNIQRK